MKTQGDQSMPTNDSAADEVRGLLDYDPETGIFKWRVMRGGVPAGSVAGGTHCQGYVAIQFRGAPRLAHRLAWLHFYGAWPEGHLDHINRDKKDNRITNLRVVTPSQNLQNTGLQKNSTSGYRGVSLNVPTGRWKAYIKVGGRRKHLGYFATPQEASVAYLAAAAQMHSHNPFVKAAQ